MTINPGARIGTTTLTSSGYNTSSENIFNSVTNYIRNNNAYQYLDITTSQDYSMAMIDITLTIKLPSQVLIDIMK